MNTIRTGDGVELEALWNDPDAAGRYVVVLCHPHPLDGGTLSAPLMESVASSLTASGAHVLRFNFRGVGRSEGTWGEGRDEVTDVDAAMTAAALAHPELPIGLAGWSFGATTSLAWQVTHRSPVPWVGIAPGVRPYRGSTVPNVDHLEPAPRLVIVGDRDQFATLDEMGDFVARFGGEMEVLGGSDHFFYFREQAVGDLVADFLARATASAE